MPNLSDQFNVDMVKSLVLPRNALCQDVVDKPSEIDVLCIFLFIDLLSFLLILYSILFGLCDNQLLD